MSDSSGVLKRVLDLTGSESRALPQTLYHKMFPNISAWKIFVDVMIITRRDQHVHRVRQCCYSKFRQLYRSESLRLGGRVREARVIEFHCYRLKDPAALATAVQAYVNQWRTVSASEYTDLVTMNATNQGRPVPTLRTVTNAYASYVSDRHSERTRALARAHQAVQEGLTPETNFVIANMMADQWTVKVLNESDHWDIDFNDFWCVQATRGPPVPFYPLDRNAVPIPGDYLRDGIPMLWTAYGGNSGCPTDIETGVCCLLLGRAACMRRRAIIRAARLFSVFIRWRGVPTAIYDILPTEILVLLIDWIVIANKHDPHLESSCNHELPASLVMPGGAKSFRMVERRRSPRQQPLPTDM